MTETIQTWQDFARVTIQTDDLDPTYVFLYNAKAEKGNDWASRFTIHYLLFYDLGGAVTVADATTQTTFWPYVLANYDRFPRGTERRHNRGDNGYKQTKNLGKKGDPLDIMGDMWSHTYTGLVTKFHTTFANCGFGPYFIWKVLDFQERIWGKPITLSLQEAVKYCPDDPRLCAAILWPDMSFREVLEIVVEEISQYDAPNGGRKCSYQEAETVLCMLKGYFLTKKHTIGDDVSSKYKQLREYPNYLKYLPPAADWTKYERGVLVPT